MGNKIEKAIKNIKELGDDGVDEIISGIIANMSAHVDVAGFQDKCAWALSTLALRSNNYIRDAIVAGGGVDAIVRGMRAHVGVAGVQEQGAGALMSLAVNSSGIRGTILTGGGVDAIVAGMGAHVGVAGVQNKGIGALLNLAIDNRDAIV